MIDTNPCFASFTLPFPSRIQDRREQQAFKVILYGDPCCYCGAPTKPGRKARRPEGIRLATVDHIVATFSGGDDQWDNLTGACMSCNYWKAARPLLGFLLMRSGWNDA